MFSFISDMIVSRIYDSFVDLVCYHDRLDDFASRLSRLSGLVRRWGRWGGWKWEGPLGMGKE